ncbi:helix-turn-helix transcriptional regulator [Mycobacteroides abscessus]|uniref:helix-turn-helix transcriptional regulator n=1 Tax=Mycobacteroides abscessus TaxID=36809 RepID=UPI000E697DB6|nr:helix-turn-helix domain-containing protein [Mycobacteroides abscessus]MBN7484549.1 helix-turn-helix domain-containing protein [Mycobacteroides abscessus subsp. abscessus]RIT75004.1 DNA-binding protein [Mycobacteroides abscessus]
MSTDTDTLPRGTVATVPRVFLRNPDAAQFLGITPRALACLRSAGGGPRYRKVGVNVYYSVDDLTEYVLAHPVIDPAQKKDM